MRVLSLIIATETSLYPTIFFSSTNDDIIELDDRNTVLIQGNTLVSSGNNSDGIEFDNHNTIDIIGITF